MSPCYPLDRRLGGPQSCSECSGKEKNSQMRWGGFDGNEEPSIEIRNLNSVSSVRSVNCYCSYFSILI
jgi:hypothetical protein